MLAITYVELVRTRTEHQTLHQLLSSGRSAISPTDITIDISQMTFTNLDLGLKNFTDIKNWTSTIFFYDARNNANIVLRSGLWWHTGVFACQPYGGISDYCLHIHTPVSVVRQHISIEIITSLSDESKGPLFMRFSTGCPWNDVRPPLRSMRGFRHYLRALLATGRILTEDRLTEGRHIRAISLFPG